MAKNGYFQIHRKFIRSDFWISSSPAKRSIIITCLALADHTEHSFKTSSRELAKECRVRRSTLLEYIKELQSDHFISVKSDHHKTVITILHYNSLHEFQKGVPTTKTATNPTTSVSQSDHNGIQKEPLRYPNQTTINNKGKETEKEKELKPVLTENDFDHNQIPYFREFYPFHERKDALVELFDRMGYAQATIANILEKFIYPNEYGYRRPA